MNWAEWQHDHAVNNPGHKVTSMIGQGTKCENCGATPTIALEDEHVEEACEVMHDAYERAAVVHGWDTNPAAKHKPWSEVPESNKATMRDAVRALLRWQEAKR